MPLSETRVRDTAAAVAALAKKLQDCYKTARALLAYNATQNITWTPATHVVTGDATANTLTKTAHGLANGQKGRMTGATLPAPLAADTDYWVVGAAANTFQLALAKGGAAIDLTTAGSGTITFNPVPDYIVEEAGTGNLSGLTYGRAEVSNAIGSIQEFVDLMGNAAVSQGDHAGNLDKVASAPNG